ncbi:MAG TPA: PQQ-dependent sugar dehydrogenase [Anaerolineales bacterium]|nr:PQQ-dependent sugar dehydrogenase [Anaerolineales bacterium]
MHLNLVLFRRSIILFVITIAACQPVPTLTRVATPSPIPTLASSIVTVIPQATSTDMPTAIPTVPSAIVELEGAELPQGFSIIKFADIYRPTAFAFDALGRLYITSTDSNVYLLSDSNADGRADSQTTFAAGYYLPLGITVRASTGEVYVSHQGGITVLNDTDSDGKADTNRTLIENLPTDLHQNDNLKFGPDGWLYMGLGSTCDACSETNPKSASILRFNVDTGVSEIYATGLRNPYDLAFSPSTGDLFSTDNGRDDLGMDTPFEELNHIVQGGNYGWPNCWNAQDQPGCENTIPAVAFFESHSSADGLDIYNGDRFPAEYRNNAFVSIFGSWLKPNVQTGIQRVILTAENGKYSGAASWFVRFPAGVMPLPLLFGPDSALYVGDYINDSIYRISYGIP